MWLISTYSFVIFGGLIVFHAPNQVDAQPGGPKSTTSVPSASSQSSTATPAPYATWAITCDGVQRGHTNITLKANPQLSGYYAVVVQPETCKQNVILDLKIENIIYSDCVDATTNSVTLSLQPNVTVRNFVGGHTYDELRIICNFVNDSGVHANAIHNATVTVADGHEKAENNSRPLKLAKLSLELVKSDTGHASDIESGQGTTSVALGQPGLYLRISGTDKLSAYPLQCEGATPDRSKVYAFFKTDDSACHHDEDVIETFTVKPGEEMSYVKFYPFKFPSVSDVKLSCEVLLCPANPAENSTCDLVAYQVEHCQNGPVPQPTSNSPASPAVTGGSGRRRRQLRSTRIADPNVQLVEMTYLVADPHLTLGGPTAAGPDMAVSVPLLAAVASLWIL